MARRVRYMVDASVLMEAHSAITDSGHRPGFHAVSSSARRRDQDRDYDLAEIPVCVAWLVARGGGGDAGAGNRGRRKTGEGMGENDKIVTRYMADHDFQGSAFPILAREILESIRAGKSSEPAL